MARRARTWCRASRRCSAAWRSRYGVTTGVGIGMCRGEAIIGNIGSPHFMSYTIIGDTVNTAARLMQMAQADEVLVSAALYDSIRPLLPAERVQARGDVALRGKSEAVAGVFSQAVADARPHHRRRRGPAHAARRITSRQQWSDAVIDHYDPLRQRDPGRRVSAGRLRRADPRLHARTQRRRRPGMARRSSSSATTARRSCS